MFTMCSCGAYRPDKPVGTAGDAGAAPSGGIAIATCPECGHEYHFQRKPLLVVGGPSGTGKSVVTAALTAPSAAQDSSSPVLVALDADVFWNECFDDRESGFALRLALKHNDVVRRDSPIAIFHIPVILPSHSRAIIRTRRPHANAATAIR